MNISNNLKVNKTGKGTW